MKPRRTPRERGMRAESAACRYLQQRGLVILARNYRTSRGEVDLVMRDGELIVFVEVRHRSRSTFMSAAESVDHRKQTRLLHAARCYIQENGLTDRVDCRFDVVLLSGPEGEPSVEWITDAFGA